jgi:hypothetical protein
MGVSVDLYAGASAHTSLANGSTFSVNQQAVNPGLANSVLFVALCDDGVGGTSFQVNWDTAGTNQLMTQVASDAVAGIGNIFFYALINPTSGSKTLGVKRTSGSTADVDVFSVSLYNADQNFNNYSVNAGTGTLQSSAAFTISTQPGCYVFSAIGTLTTSPGGPTGGTARFGPDVLTTGVEKGADTLANSTSVTHTYSLSPSDNFIGVIISITGSTAWGFDSNTSIGDSVALMTPGVRKRYAGTKGKSEFAIFSNNFQYLDFMLQPPQPPQPNRPRRASAIMLGEAGIETTENSAQFNFGGFIQSWQPPHPVPEKRAAAIMPWEDGIELPKINWFNTGWEVQPVQPPHPAPERRAAGTMRGDDGMETTETKWFNFGWEIQSYQPQHLRPERSGSITRGDEGTENQLLSAFFTTSWGFEIQSVQPPWPGAVRPSGYVPASGAIAHGDDGIEFPLLNWFNGGWEIQSVQPLHQFREKRGVFMFGEIGTEAAFVPPTPIVNWGFDPFLPLFSKNPKIAQRYPGTRGKSVFAIFPNFYPFGFEVQPVQPPHRTPEKRAAAVMPKEDGIENIYTFIQPGFITSNWGFDPQLFQPSYRPTIPMRAQAAFGNSEFAAASTGPFTEIQSWQPPHPKPERFGSIVRGLDGTEAKEIPFLGYWGFEIQSVQPPWAGSQRGSAYVPGAGAIARGDDGIELPLINFFADGWEIPSFQVYNQTRLRFGAIAPYANAPEIPIVSSNLVSTGWEVPSFELPYNRWKANFGAFAPFSSVEIPFQNWYNIGFEVQPVQPPHPHPERAGSIMPIEPGIEAAFIFNPLNPLVSWAFEAYPPQPPHPRSRERGGIMPIETGIEAPFVFVPIQLTPWGFDAPITYKQVPFNRFGAIARGDEGIQLPEVRWFNTGWEIQPPPPPHQFRERRGAFLRGDEGIEAAKINWFNNGYEVQPPPPPHQFREQRGTFLRGDEGIQAPLFNFIRAGWTIQHTQPPHPRAERSGAIMPIEPGIEAVYVFVTPPVLSSLAPLDVVPVLRWPMTAVSRGAILLFDGLGLPFFPFIPPIPPTPPLATAAKVIGLDADFGGADVTRVFLSRVPSNLFVGDSIAVIIGVGGDLNLTASYRMVFTKPDGTQFHIDSPNTYVGRVDAPTRQGTFDARTYTICVLTGQMVDQHGTWTCYLQAPNFTSMSQPFYIGPPPMLV